MMSRIFAYRSFSLRTLLSLVFTIPFYILYCTRILEWFKSYAAGIDGVHLSGILSQPAIWSF